MFRLALVTGATSGIGEALCLLLAEKGIGIIATGRDPDKLNALNRVCIKTLAADLKNRKERQMVIKLIQEMTPDLVINSAGFGLYGDALTYPTEEQMDILEVNGTAMLEVTLEAARAMVTKGIQGIIINISSAAAFPLFPGCAVYSAAKAFVNHFSQSFDLEMQPHGVRVLAVCPGMVATQFRQRAGGGGDLPRSLIKPMSAQSVAKEIWQQILSGKALKIIDWKYRALTWVMQYFIPKKWVANILKAEMAKRAPNHILIKDNTDE